jgi:hypothetical protein
VSVGTALSTTYFEYEDASKTVVLRVPTSVSGELVFDDFGQPVVEAFWVATGLPVVFTGNWAVGDTKNASNILDVTNINYTSNPDLKFAIRFKVRYLDSTRQGLSEIPKQLISIVRSNISSITPEDHFSYAFDTDNTPRLVKLLSTVTNIGGIDYADKLYIQPVGNTYKYHTYEYHMYKAGSGNSAPYIISDVLSPYEFVGLLEVRNGLTNEVIEVTDINWTPNPGAGFQITLANTYANNIPLVFIFAVGMQGSERAKQMNLNLGSLSLQNISICDILTVTASSTPSNSQPNSNQGIYRIANPDIIYGASATNFKNGYEHVVYVGSDIVKCNIQGIGTNVLTINLARSNITGLDNSNWVQITPGTYVPNNVAIRIPIIKALRFNYPIYIAYKYAANPLIPFIPNPASRYAQDSTTETQLAYQSGESNKIVHRGYILLSQDGVGNERASFASPLSERFPKVQGVDLIGVDVPPGVLGFNDVLLYQHTNIPLLEGTTIKLDSSLTMNLNVEPGKGQIIYICLLKQLNILRLFVYIVSAGSFIINNSQQAFVCELEHNYRELANE